MVVGAERLIFTRMASRKKSSWRNPLASDPRRKDEPEPRKGTVAAIPPGNARGGVVRLPRRCRGLDCARASIGPLERRLSIPQVLIDECADLFGAGWLGEKWKTSQHSAVRLDFRFSHGSGQENDWDVLQFMIHPQGAGNVTAVLLRHDEIQNDQMRLEFSRRGNRTSRVVFCPDFILAGFLESDAHEAGQYDLVIDDQNAFFHLRGARRIRGFFREHIKIIEPTEAPQ